MSCSQASTCRRLSTRRLGSRRWASAANAPPASISGSWWWSPTSTTFASAAAAWSSSRVSLRVPTMAASSTTTTCRSVSPGVPGRSRSISSRSRVTDGMREPSWSCRAARADNAAPITTWRLSPHACAAAPSATVLPAPAAPSTRSIACPDRVMASTIWRCSPLNLAWRERTSSSVTGSTSPALVEWCCSARSRRWRSVASRSAVVHRVGAGNGSASCPATPSFEWSSPGRVEGHDVGGP